MKSIPLDRAGVILLACLSLAGCAVVRPQPEEHSAYQAAPNDVVMGMSVQDVRESWGTPRDVEVAGNPDEGNQRWIYRSGLTPGLNSERILYFEQGRLVGWETTRQ